MSKRFQGKTAVLTGAASGIALLCAQKYAEEGANVCMVDTNEEGVNAAAAGICEKGGVAVGVKADIRDYAQVRSLSPRWLERID